VHRVFVRNEADVGRHPGKPLAVKQIESRKDIDLTDLLCRHHVRHLNRPVATARLPLTDASDAGAGWSA